jgi:molybdenum cofactor cytidylyltransferase
VFVSGLVLAAGGSRRLGRPKQLLEYGGRPLLAATLDTARVCDLDQVLVALRGAGELVRAAVDLTDCTVVDNVHHTSGCSSSIVTALEQVDRRADGLVLLLGDQPHVDPDVIRRLRAFVADAADAAGAAVGSGSVPPIVACRYDDGRGHPFWFARSMFGELSRLCGDKAVWKLVASGRWSVQELRVEGPVPLDVDTWDDYRRLLESVS